MTPRTSSVPRIPLWSFHRADFSLVKEAVRPELSEYYNSGPGIAAAYHELWRRFGSSPPIGSRSRS